ncbi:ATP-binding protein [Bacillus sp. CGMCC 1.16541]|uniref:ATP-binding protein n=1 Tax=Bacillus sp. CGMCC 1.16541 TaxID=2185143 RepID=UPI000D7370DA|nr:ATP-binding protein [Bacillus sp. CGMCC 1.16541]
MSFCQSCGSYETYNFCRFCGQPMKTSTTHNESHPLMELENHPSTNTRHVIKMVDIHELILQHTHDLVCVIDMNGIYQYASPSYDKQLCINHQSLIGTYAFSTIYEEDRVHVEKVLEAMLKTKTAASFEYRKVHTNGSLVLLEGKGMPVLNKEGDVESLVFISRDVTEQRKIEAIILNSKKLSVIGELAASVAHEIRNPLTSIKGFIQLLKEKHTAQDDHYYHLIMEEELNQIEQIVKEFMSLAKQEATPFKQLNIIQLLQDVVCSFQVQDHFHHITFITEFEAQQELLIEGQYHKLKQVFIHIMKNSIEAIQSSGHITIKVEETQENEVIISISDDGCGIDIERVNRIGEPFYTTKERGVGLGLTISNKVINEHFGTFKVTSKRFEGTTVKVALPQKQTMRQ